MSKCVVRIHQVDAAALCKEFGKEEELAVVVKRKDQYTLISLPGGLTIAKVFMNTSKWGKRTTHNYFLYGNDKDDVLAVLSAKCQKRIRGCFIPIPQL